VLVVTHDRRLFRFADRVAHMDDGRIVETADGASLGARPILEGVN
jgi:putative ABC transport system ATP-binding protein